MKKLALLFALLAVSLLSFASAQTKVQYLGLLGHASSGGG